MRRFGTAKYGGKRKGEVRKAALEKAIHIAANISSISAETVWDFYQLSQGPCSRHDVPNPKSSNCRDNPYCLHRLGLEKFEKLIKQSQNENQRSIENNKRRDVEKEPCGLVNYGNFCYVNSFLQICFNDRKFRQIIFDWRPSDVYERPAPPAMDVQLVMDSLQELFFTLETTPYEDAEVKNFCASLRLGNDQQDAQEFTLMFFDALDRNLMKHPNGKPVREAIEERFSGRYSTTLDCSCGANRTQDHRFSSLQLSIEGKKTLTDAIQSYLAPESLTDYRCEECREKGKVTRMSSFDVLPPVLLIQLNRYVFDGSGRNKKLKTPLQYPRELSSSTLMPGSKPFSYELSAVMIHEGDSTDCGHYFDIIRHPETKVWYKYNDEKVSAHRPPGVDHERPSAPSKPPIDLRACYGLVYRRVEPLEQMRLPPKELTNKWENNIEKKFEHTHADSVLQSGECLKEVRDRRATVGEIMKDLEVRTDRAQQKRARDIAFLPTEMIADVITKEYERAVRIKEALEKISIDNENENAAEEDPTEHVKEDPDESTLSPRRSRQRRVKSLFSRTIEREEVSSMLGVHKMNLCPHGNISLERILNGELKAVYRPSAEILLTKYDLTVRSMTDNNPSTCSPAKLKTGLEVCEKCVLDLVVEAHFRKKVDEDAALATRIAKDKTRCSVLGNPVKPPDYLYISKKALGTFKRDAILEMERLKAVEKTTIVSIVIAPTDAKIPAITVSSRRRKRVIDLDEEGSDDGSTTKKTKNEEDDDKETEEAKEKGGEDTDCVAIDEDKQKPAKEESPDESLEGTSGERGRSSSLANSEDADMDDDDTSLEEMSPTNFNRELLCPHGLVNVCEFRQAVSPEEWAKLTTGYFSKIFTVKCSTPICSECHSMEREAEQDKLQTKAAIRTLAAQFAEFVKRCTNRTPRKDELGTVYTRGLCSRFLQMLTKATKSTSSRSGSNVPMLCQNCLFCDAHNLPYVGIEPINEKSLFVVPITEAEWTRLTEEISGSNRTIEIDSQGIVGLCTECNDEMVSAETSKMYVYEKEFIYVKMQEDETTPVTENGTSSSGAATNGVSRSSTRRAQAKSLLKVKLSSSSSIRDLKVLLYPMTRHSPADQLLYSSMGGQPLVDEHTLQQSLILPNNVDKPLILVVQTRGENGVCSAPEVRTIEKGFTDTALAH